MKITSITLLFSLLCWSFLFAGPGFAAEDGKAVAILPFTLNGPPDKEYLREGLRDILASRLRTEVQAEIAAKPLADSALQAAGGKAEGGALQEIAGKTGADYLVFGSITALGGGIAVDARVYPSAGQDIRHFSVSAISNDQIMQAIDTLSWDIIEGVFGKKRPASMLPARQQAPARDDTTSGFTTAHPEKTFMLSGGGTGIKSGRNFTKTRNFDISLKGFDLGDIDGDGELEVIMADTASVLVFKRDGTRLNQMGMVQMDARFQVHSINVADLNGNGRAEIYISAAAPDLPGSRAVEWDGEQFTVLFDQARWYIRPMDVPGIGPVLLGQAAGLTPVQPGIYQLSLIDGKLSSQEKLPLPAGVNLFNFAYADLDGDGRHEVVILDENFKLQVLKGGSVIWKSEERFAGTKRFVGGEPAMRTMTSPSANDIIDGVGDKFKRTYIPSRILISDVDQDGADDIIINQNPETLTTVAPRVVQYKSGSLVGLRWNGMGLEEMWRTRKIDGYPVDYQVKSLVKKPGDAEGDELFVGVVLNSGAFDSLLGDQATLLIYPFEFKQSENN